MRVAINLLTDDPRSPSGAHWFWTRVIPEMSAMLVDGEEFHLVVSPQMRPLHDGYGPGVHYIHFPWSNEKRDLRTLSEHVLTPFKLPRAKIDIFSTLMAPIVNPSWSVVAHLKTMHAYTSPDAISPAVRMYRQFSYPRTMRVAEAVIVNSESLRQEVHEHLEVDPAKLHLIPEAVDHDLFNPGNAAEARHIVRSRYGVTKPFVLFVSSLWPYKNCEGAIRAFAAGKQELGDRQLVVVGPGRDEEYLASLRRLAAELGDADDVLWVGGVPLEETVNFYRAADVFVYPSLNETFGLPILEAMASGCPVVTSDLSAMPETAGDAALLADPHDTDAIAGAILEACGSRRRELVDRGLVHAAKFTWRATAESTLAVYRDVYRRRSRKGREA